MARTIIIGDLHGCLDELQELVSRLKLSPEDRVVCLGDFMDKGPSPAACLQYVRSMGFESVLGNHEEKHVRWRRHKDRQKKEPSYQIPMRPLGPRADAQNDLLTEEDILWMKSLPAFIRVAPHWVVVHGGLLPGAPVEDQDKTDIIRLRWVDPVKVKPVATDYDSPDAVPAGTKHWSELYDGRDNVVTGHEAHSLVDPLIVRNDNGGTCYGIDTGVVHGGRLTALVLESDLVSFVQVQAKDRYDHHLQLSVS